MPELEQEAETRVTEQALRRAVAAAALQVPGVLRIEPGLVGAIRSWARSAPEHEIGWRTTDAGTDVTVHVAVLAGHQARQVAHALRERVTETMRAHGVTAGEVEICVLSIETQPAGVYREDRSPGVGESV